MRRFRAQHSRSKKSPAGRHSVGFGGRVGYWPCLRGLYIQISFASHRIDAWYGLESYKEEGQHG